MSRKVLDIKKVRETREALDRTAQEAAKMAKPSSKPVRLRDKRRRQQMIALCICVLGLLGIVGGLGGASHLERLSIQSVEVHGAQLLSAGDVQQSVRATISPDSFELFSRRNIFLYPRSRIEAELSSAYPRIQTVAVQREALFAQALSVQVKERAPYALWCAGASYTDCYVMDREGFVYAKQLSDRPETQYVFRGGMALEGDPVGQTFLLGRLEKMTELLAYLAQNGYGAEGVHVENDKDFEVPLLRGPVLKISFAADPADLVRNLELALESETLKNTFTSLEYVDLRFGNRVYFKMKGTIAAASEGLRTVESLAGEDMAEGEVLEDGIQE